MDIKRRICNLREEMKKSNTDAYIILSDDFHASEYVCDYFKCREYMSGFTGSAGTLVIMRDDAALWTDGRYFIQAQEQLEGTGIALMKSGEEGVPDVFEYLSQKLSDGQCVGYDGRTVSVSYAKKMKKSLSGKNILYKEKLDLVGKIWNDRPDFPNGNVWLLEEKYAGRSRREKLRGLREALEEEGADALLLSSLDDIAWLYNMRGEDIKYTPVALAYTIVYRDAAVLYRDGETFRGEVLKELKRDGVENAPYFQVYDDLKSLKNITLHIDENSINTVVRKCIPDNVNIICKKSPTTVFKAKKNRVEVKNEIYAHILDGVAVTKLIYFLKKAAANGEIENITELDVCEKLERFREEGEGYLGQSFAPIIASGAHGAIVHYEPTAESNIPLEKDTFVLMDTGGQYLYGTTDITRTIATGRITHEQKMHYTAVLKGNLNLAKAIFKYGCTGANLDYLARKPLWELGMDFNHGTGHGVGYLLNVHEGPNGIRLREADGSVGTALEEGMITSDEPGLYLEGKYGIRTENLLLCVKDKKTEYGQFMRFETLTKVPYDRDAILPQMLTEEEKQALNAYHLSVYDSISPYLNEDEQKWLKEATREI